MRKAIAVFISLFSLAFGLLTVSVPAGAQSLSAAQAFGTLGGTTTIDQGGSIHSQARSIYSFGGGMTSVNGKRVTLLSADPPGMSAGCSGISWHFGGFAFISMDELRQLVEAVAQASLGIAIDLAMQTLCPQCYAVMAKLRDIVNAMRNAAADACKIAKNMGVLLMKELGVTPPSERSSSCSGGTAAEGKSDGWLNSAAGSLCRGMEGVNKWLDEQSTNILPFLNGNLASGAKTPTDDILSKSFNVQYSILTALGYQDGFIKDILLNYLGMTVYHPTPSPDCTNAFGQLYGTSWWEKDGLGPRPGGAVGSVGSGEPKATDAVTKDPTVNPGDAKKAPPTCYAPPTISGVDEMAKKLICGFNPKSDAEIYQRRFGFDDATMASTALGQMCSFMAIKNVEAGAISSKEEGNPPMYSCNSALKDHSACLNPSMKRYNELLSEPNPGMYTGLAWYISDALLSGAAAVSANENMPEETLAILNGSGYPLYRLLNMAAVYTGMTQEILNAYSMNIAIHYTLDTFDKLARPGSLPTIDLRKSTGGLDRADVRETRAAILNMFRDGTPMRDKSMKTLSEKRALVESIVQINRALQAEVVSQGLLGNANLALSLKSQLSRP